MKRVIPNLVAAAILFSAGAASANVVYNLSDNWSDVSNPNGVWSLNYNNTIITNHFYFGSQGYWGDYTSLDGSFSKSVTDHSSHDWLIGDIAIHALSTGSGYPGSSTFTNVKWTSPSDGIINIYGQAWDAYFYSNRQASWTITLNGEILAQRSGVRDLFRTDAEAQFNNNIVSGKSLSGIIVNAGDIVQFTTKAETGFGHFVGLNMNVQLIPEPATICILAIGALTLLRRKNNERRNQG